MITKERTSFSFRFLNLSVVKEDRKMNLLFIVVLNILAVGYGTPDHEKGLKVEDPGIRGWRKGDHTKGVQRLLLQGNFEV